VALAPRILYEKHFTRTQALPFTVAHFNVDACIQIHDQLRPEEENALSGSVE
jgi:hypothetical protein